jgi:hypothetical protein
MTGLSSNGGIRDAVGVQDGRARLRRHHARLPQVHVPETRAQETGVGRVLGVKTVQERARNLGRQMIHGSVEPGFEAVESAKESAVYEMRLEPSS